jgi:hypothetical protein
MEDFKNIQQAIDQLLKVKSSIKRRNKAKQDQARDLFVSVVNSLQMLHVRTNLLYTDLKLDYSSYDESFLEIIDALLMMKFGKDACEIISFYLWERINPDGTTNPIFDENENEIPLETAIDLWNVVQKLAINKDKWKD